MRKVSILPALLVLTVVFSTPAFAGSVVLRALYEDKEQPPYYLAAGETIPDKPGIAVEMVSMLEEYVPGLVVEFSRAPWTRCLATLESGEADAIFNSSYNEGRLKAGRYPTLDGTPNGKPDTEKRITTIAYHLYKTAGSDIAWNGKEIAGLGSSKVGAILGYSIIGDLKKLNVSVNEVAAGTPAILKMLVAGRFPAAALQDVTADALIASTPEYAEKLVKDERPIVSKPYYLMLSHQFVARYPETAKQIWDAIEKIRNEKFSSLAQKYSDN